MVQRTVEKRFNYSAQDAQQDFAAHRDLVEVRIVISITPVATQVNGPIKGLHVTRWPTTDDDGAAERALDSWYGFHFKISQEKVIPAKKITIVDVTPPFGDQLIVERAIDLQFDAAQFSAGTATIEVTSPDDKTIRAEFDLDKLK
jgi:hypothetical protein